MKIIGYTDSKNIVVQFLDNSFITNAQYVQFQKGDIRNPEDKTIFNKGYVGIGDYKTSENKIYIHRYKIWASMLERCYDPKRQKRQPTYANCTVCDEWHNYQNFADWYDENYYEIPNEVMHLDKDILIKGNKIYSPDNCVFVSMKINSLFVKRDRDRGKCPIGVYFFKRTNQYISHCNNGNGQAHLGYFNTPEEAFIAYKKYKEAYIKQVAEEYKKIIPKRLYDAMYKYEVEITD
ncbi:MAG: AP2 domain-containing protein [archaeon]|jgi:hypothetical protein